MAQPHCERMNYGHAFVVSKIKESLTTLRGYGLEREIADSLRNEYDSRKSRGLTMPFETFRATLMQTGARYSAAHGKLTVWNEAQWHAREAAVALGRMQSLAMLRHLTTLEQWTRKPIEAWNNWAGAVTLNGDQIIPFTPINSA